MKSLLKTTLRAVSIAGLAALAAAPIRAAYPVGFHGAGTQKVIDSVTGPSGAVYVVGTFDGNIGAGGEVHAAVGLEDVFVAKVSSFGAVLWLKTGGGASTDQGLVIGVDPAENVYIGGIYFDDATFGETGDRVTLPEHGNNHGDIFLVKLAGSDGKVQWAGRASGEGNDVVKGLAFIPGNPDVFPPVPDLMVLGGSFQCRLHFYDEDGDASSKASHLDAYSSCPESDSGRRLPLVAAITTSGSWQWRFSGVSTPSNDGADSVGAEIRGFATDSDHRIYVYGLMRESLSFDLREGADAVFPPAPELGLHTDSDSGPEWRVDSGRSYSANYSAHFPAGDAAKSVLEFPSVHLDFGEIAELEFRHSYDMGELLDLGTFGGELCLYCSGSVQARLDGGSWFDLDEDFFTAGGPPADNGHFCGSRSSFGRVVAHVAAIPGVETIQFRLAATCGRNDPGWWVDDIEIRKNGQPLRSYDFAAEEPVDRYFVGRVSNDGGGWQWVKQLPDHVALRNIAVDHHRNIVLVGDKRDGGTSSFPLEGGGTTVLPATDGAFVGELDPSSFDAEWTWVKSTVGGEGRGVYIDSDNSIYLTGPFSGNFHRTPTAPALASAGGTDIYVARLDDNGVFFPGSGSSLWGNNRGAVRAGGTGTDTANTITGDGVGQLYVGGFFQNVASFGSGSLTATDGFDAVVAHLDSTGLFAEQASGNLVVGEPVVPPAAAELAKAAFVPDFRLDGAPFEALESYFKWSPPAAGGGIARLIPIRALSRQLEIRWRVAGQPLESAQRISTFGALTWPIQRCDPPGTTTKCYQLHLAGAPVEIRPDAGGPPRSFLELHQEGGNASVVNNIFKSAGGFATLVYVEDAQPDPANHPLDVRVVRTVQATDPLADGGPAQLARGGACTIGSPLAPSPAEHDQPGRTGYVLNEKAFYDGAGAQGAYDRAARTGWIVPVNRVNGNRTQDDGKSMQVAWYKYDDIRVAWPQKAIEYDCEWPTAPRRIIVASEQGSEVLGQLTFDPLLYKQVHLYQQPDVALPGYNPNDEHALFAPSNSGSPNLAIFALRRDFGGTIDPAGASDPYVIAKYFDQVLQLWKHEVYRVDATGGGFDAFRYAGFAGRTVEPPYPVRLEAPCPDSKVVGELKPSPPPVPFYRDKNSQLWARAAGAGAVRYHYRLQPNFFYDLDNDDTSDLEAASCIPWMARLPESAGGISGSDTPIEVAYEIAWPQDVPLLTVGETLLRPKRGLPDIYGQAATKVIYDDRQQAQPLDPSQSLAQLIDPLGVRQTALAALPTGTKALATSIDDQGRTVITGNAAGTRRLPYSLHSRLRFDPLTLKLRFSGVFDESGAGDPLLLLNVMTSGERNELRALSTDLAWGAAIDRLFALSRNPNGVRKICTASSVAGGVLTCGNDREVDPERDVLIGVVDENDDGLLEPFLAEGQPAGLTAGAAQGTGYLTLAFNDSKKLALPVSLEVIRVGCLSHPEPPATPTLFSPYIGQIHVIGARNVFDEQVTLRHSGDFGGRVEELEFEWFEHPDLDGTPPPPPDIEGGALGGWQQIPVAPAGAVQIVIGGANIKTLSDNWYFARYKGLPACGNETEWTVPAGQPGSIPTAPRAQLSPGWVKRVVAGLNPFDARVAAFHTAATNTFASMVSQLGQRYEGPIAFSDDPANLNRIGLIEAYETVFRRARQLSIDSTPPVNYEPANAALLNVASRIADFYMLLGNEAYADAEDPTIGITTDTLQFGFGSLAPTIFNFQNQSASLLEEELILLRGRDDRQGPTAANPVYNRYFWNFTQGDGEVAYALSYNVSDQNSDGFVNEFDARIQYPQGHGDAWGHYLTAATTYYQLLRHPFYSWNPRPEAVPVAGVPLQIDYLDERKFARIAAARARAGAQIVDLTYRSLYVEDPAGQWQGYSDTIAARAWGLSEWGRRVGQGAYLDWMVGNSLLPELDPNPAHVGIQRIDRKSVDDLDEISAAFAAVQSQVDEADRGVNPLGAAKGVVPFDIDPTRVDAGETHFEQIYGRAKVALANAVQVWDFANSLNRMLRFNQDGVGDLTLNSKAREHDFRNRLIEIFGRPYENDLGPGGTYPADYAGPDIYHYNYVNAPALTGTPFAIDGIDQVEHLRDFTGKFEPLPGGIEFFDFLGQDLECVSDPREDGCSLGDRPDTKLEVDYLTWELPVLSSFAMIKPKAWQGVRPSAGRVQEALDEILNAQIAGHQALSDYENLRLEIEAELDTLEAVFNLRRQSLTVKNQERKELWQLTDRVQWINAGAITLRRIGALVGASFEKANECVPKNTIVGTASGGDLTSMLRCGTGALSNKITFAMDTVADGMDILQSVAESAKEDVSLQAAIQLDIVGFSEDMYAQQGKVQQLLRQEPLLRNEIYSRAQVVEQARQNYRDALAEGLRTLEELVVFRKSTAAAVQGYRYQDMAFRVFRNDALQKYRAAFDLAARFTYLAATAYDYDTNLLGGSGNSGRKFLTDIVRQRSLGQILNGVPVPGSPGLADPLGRMAANFGVLKTQMGFNNPQIETNRFSLRSNLFRLDPDADAAADWRTELLRYRVEDLWDVPEFRRHVRPFTEEALGPQPGLVIPFSTTVTFGLNFFGWPLAAGDSAYDPSQFATRVRSVGVWFDGYGNLPLSATPRVYLVPVGADILRPPTAGEFTTREWSVVDQLIPLPFALGSGELADPDWRPLDTLSGGFTEIRRFGSFRAYDYNPNGPFGDQTTTDNRLIGRSVWNTRWLLIVPGGTLLFDPQDGIDSFIGDDTTPGVSDILIFFKTYAYQGF